MSSSPVVFSDQDIDQSGQSSKPITFGEDEIQHAPHDFTAEALSGKLAAPAGSPAKLPPESAAPSAPAVAQSNPAPLNMLHVGPEGETHPFQPYSAKKPVIQQSQQPLIDPVTGYPTSEIKAAQGKADAVARGQYKYTPRDQEILKAVNSADASQTATLAKIKKYAVDPADAMAHTGSEVGRQVAGRALVTPPTELGATGDPNTDAPVSEEQVEERLKDVPAPVVGAARAVGSTVGGMAADPRMWPFFFSGGAAPVLQKVATAGFAGQMAHGSYVAAGELGKVMDNPSVPREDKWEAGASLVMSTIMAAQATAHSTNYLGTKTHIDATMKTFESLPPQDQEGIRQKLRQKAPGIAAAVDRAVTQDTFLPSTNGAKPQTTPAGPAAPALEPGIASMVKANASATMAKNVVAGRPAVPPPVPPPPSPGEQFGNKLSGAQVDHLAQTIAKVPEGKRNEVIDEAHQNLTQWIADNKGKVVVDGKIHIAKTPDAAEALAAKLINDGVAAHDKATAEAAKVQEAASTPEPKAKPAADVQRFLSSSRPASTTEARRQGEETGKSAKIVQNAQNVQNGPSSPQPASNQVEKQEAAPVTNSIKETSRAAPQQSPAEAPTTFTERDIQPAHEYASTQVNIEPKSELGKRHAEAVAAIPEDHLGPNGKEETPHVTVRYGLKDDSPEAIAHIKDAAAKIAPFEATVGKTGSFPATKEGDHPIIAHVEKSPELNALRSAVEGAGEFKPDDHGEYKPHVTLGYVKPEHVSKYEGGNHLEGDKVPVDHVTVTKRDGTEERIPLGGGYKYEPLAHDTVPAGKTFYHGTPHGLTELKDADPVGFSGELNIYGPGLYLTDNPKVAEGYKRTRKPDEGRTEQRHVLSAELPGAKVLDLEKPLPEKVLQLFNKRIEKYTPLGMYAFPEGTKGTHIYSELRDESAAQRIPAYEIQDLLGDISQNLVEMGYHGLRHEGGRSAGKKYGPHNVVVLFPDYDSGKGTVYGNKPDRRSNLAERKRVADMKPEEMARELHTSRLDNGDGTHTEMPIPNGRAFHDALSSPAVAMSDADALKAFNDKFGYKAGNTILVAKAEAAKEAGLDAYHQKGDEFLYRGDSAEQLNAGLEKAREILRNREFTVTDSEGKTVTLKGVDFSYGTGTDLKAAESGLKAHKTAREAAGERARGELRGITEVGHETAAESGTKEPASEVAPQTFHESEIEHQLPEGDPTPPDIQLARTESGKIKLGADVSSLGKVLGSSLYQGRAPKIITKELIQNAFDAVRSSGNKEIHVDLDTRGPDGIITVSDTGKGMSKDELETVFTDLGSSGKRGQEDASGGFGLAKAAPLMMSKRLEIKTVVDEGGKRLEHSFVATPEQMLGEGVDVSTREVGRSVPTGTAIKAFVDKSDGMWGAEAFVRDSRKSLNAPGELSYSSNGKGQELQEHQLDKQPLTKAAIPGAEITIYRSREINPIASAFGALEVEIHNNGIYQFDNAVYNPGAQLRGMPTRVAVDVHATVPEGDKDYPFLANRESLRSAAQGAINEIIKREIIQPAVSKEREIISQLYHSLPTIAGTKMPLFDAGGRFKEKELKEMQSNPVVRELADKIQSLVSRVIDKSRASGMMPVSATDIGKTIKRVGLVFSDKIHGVFITDPKDTSHATLLIDPFNHVSDSPWNAASLIWHTIKHEIVHDVAKGHDETFTTLEKDLSRSLGQLELHALRELSEVYGDPNNQDRLRPDINRPLQIYRESRGRPETQADIFGGENLRRGGEHEPDGEGRDAGSVRESGTGIVRKGDIVTLADGRKGEVQFVDANMNVARVKVDGKSVTVGLKTLKDKSGESGFARLNVPSAVADMVKAAHEKVLAPTENRIARGIDDTLYQLGKQSDADVLRVIKLLKAVGPTTSPEDQAAIYHHKEDSGEALTARQQANLDGVVQPLMDANSEMRAKLNKAGVPMGEDDGYIHREVQGKNNQMERAMRGKGAAGKGNVLSKAASSLKGRRMFAAEDEDGNRVVVHRNGDTMTAFDNGNASEFAKDKPGLQVGDEFNDKDGQRWTLKQATTKEIEQQTGVRYYKNALANTVVDYLQLRRAERANDALNAMKEDPEFKSLSFKPEHGEMPPDGWRTVNLPQFNGYHFEKHLAETLDRFADELHADPAGAMEKIGNLMTASLVLNPARHVYNIGNHWLVERGVSGNFNVFKYPRSFKAGIRAIKAVVTQNDDFVSALDHGAPMMSHRQDLRELQKHLVDSILGYLDHHTDAASMVAKAAGYANHLDMMKGLYKLGQKMTWMSNDMFFLQAAYEKALGGMPFEEAAAETAKHIPDYRIPPRVLNSHGLSKFMNSHMLTVFSRYHYGVWKSYGQMIKEVASPDSSLKDRAKGLDHMLMLGLLTFVAYEAWDKLLKKATGDSKARMVRSGASAVPYLVNEIAQGNKPPEELIQGTFTPSVLPKTAAELAFNRDFYSGSRIYDRHDTAANIAHDVGKKITGALGPTQQVEKAERSETPTRDFLAYQGGVTFPNTEVQSPAVRLMHEILRENMTLTPEMQRQVDDKRARIQSGNLTQKERKTQLKKQALDELSYYLPHVARYSDVKKVFNAATPEEKEAIRPIMLKKALSVMRSNPIEGAREGALQAFEER